VIFHSREKKKRVRRENGVQEDGNIYRRTSIFGFSTSSIKASESSTQAKTLIDIGNTNSAHTLKKKKRKKSIKKGLKEREGSCT
jgi:1,2-phenylacetyl-CoA epoxidase PaaB subunit